MKKLVLSLLILFASCEAPKTGVSEEDLNGIQKKLSSYLNKDAELTFEVDSSLIGGLKIQVGSQMIDSSIKNQLNLLKAKMKEVA